MIRPFDVRDGDDPGFDLGSWDEHGNVHVVGDLVVEGTLSAEEIDGGEP